MELTMIYFPTCVVLDLFQNQRFAVTGKSGLLN